MRWLPALVVILLAPLARATTYTATACTSAAFTTALASAADGDTVQGPVSGGSATWSSTVTVGKNITLNGNACSITFSGSGGLTVNVDSSASLLSVTGFTFSACGNTNLQINYAAGPPYDSVWRFYNNTISASDICIQTDGLGPGLIDHNTITTSSDAAELIHILGGPANCSSCWAEDVVPGGANMLFLENNIWTETNTSNYAQAEEAYYGAVFVMRHNQLNYVQGDVHGSGGDGPGTRWYEIYDNAFNHCCASSSFYDLRGGSGIVFGNTATNTSGSTNMSLGPIGGSSDNCASSYPSTGYDFGQGLNGTTASFTPFYMWGSVAPQVSPYNNCPAMVGIGTSPNSGSSPPINAVVTTTAPSTLLRCESAADVSAGCPVAYTYTSYTYPHPQDNCESNQYGSGATCGGALASATNLTGTLITGTKIQ